MNDPVGALGFAAMPRPCSASVPSDAAGRPSRGTAGWLPFRRVSFSSIVSVASKLASRASSG